MLSAVQKAKPIVRGDDKHEVHVEKTVLGGCASALQPAVVVTTALVHDPVLERHP